MKKLLLLAAVILYTVSSCKKDYVCECAFNYNSLITKGATTVHDTKKKAKATCEGKSVKADSAQVVCNIK